MYRSRMRKSYLRHERRFYTNLLNDKELCFEDYERSQMAVNILYASDELRRFKGKRKQHGTI